MRSAIAKEAILSRVLRHRLAESKEPYTPASFTDIDNLCDINEVYIFGRLEATLNTILRKRKDRM